MLTSFDISIQFTSAPSHVRTTSWAQRAIVVLQHERPYRHQPGLYLGADSSTRGLRSLLGSVDLLTLWILALAALGGAIVVRARVRSGVILVFVAWLVVVLLKAGVAIATG